MKIETKCFYVTFKNEWFFITNDYDITPDITVNTIVFNSKSEANIFIDKFYLKFQNFLNMSDLSCLNNKKFKFLATPTIVLKNFTELSYAMQYMFLKMLQEYRESNYTEFYSFIKNKNEWNYLELNEQLLETMIFI